MASHDLFDIMLDLLLPLGSGGHWQEIGYAERTDPQIKRQLKSRVHFHEESYDHESLPISHKNCE